MSIKYLSSVDFVKNQLLNPCIHGSSGAPSGSAGQLYYDTGTQQLNLHNGTSWSALATGGSYTWGIADTNKVQISGTGTTSGMYARFTTTGIVGVAVATVLSDIGAMPSSYLDTSTTLGGGAASNTKVPSQLAVKTYADGLIAANNAMVYKGTVGTGGTYEIAAFNSLSIYSIGWTYKVSTAGTIKGQVCQVGDMLIALVARAGSGQVDTDWTVVQNNVDGAVTNATGTSVANNFVKYTDTAGKVVSDSGYNSSSFAPAAGSASVTTLGTVTTGTWNATVINSTYGGTGVNNGGRTLTLNTNSGTIAFSAASKTLTIANTLTLSGTDSSTLNIGSGGTLGTAAYLPSGTFATSAQGILADNALPKSAYTGINTIVYGTAASVTTALTVGLSTFVGRKATGDIAAMTVAEARTLLNVADGAQPGTVTKYAGSIGNGVLTTITVTHNLNTRDITYMVYEAGTPYSQVHVDCSVTTVNSIDLVFSTAPTTNQYRVVVMA